MAQSKKDRYYLTGIPKDIQYSPLDDFEKLKFINDIPYSPQGLIARLVIILIIGAGAAIHFSYDLKHRIISGVVVLAVVAAAVWIIWKPSERKKR